MGERSWGFIFPTVAPGEEHDSDWHRWIGVLSPMDPNDPTRRILPYGMRIRVTVDADRRLVCTGVRLGGYALGDSPDSGTEVEVTAASLREIRLTEILEQLREWTGLPDWMLAGLGISAAIGTRAPEPMDRRPVGRRGHPDSFYQEVAGLYRAAGAVKPVKRIAEHYVVAPATAKGYVRRARERGFLGGSILGKAGERSKTTADNAATPRHTTKRKG